MARNLGLRPLSVELNDLYEQGIRHLAAFLGISEEEARKRAEDNPAKRVADAWAEANPQTPEEVDRFYRETDAYLGDLLMWNRSDGYARRIAPLLYEKADRVADFGGGIGTLCILWQKQGRKLVAYIDVPGKTREFAEQRFFRTAGAGRVLPQPSLGDGANYDLISAIDTLEHIHPDRIDETARQIAEALTDGGKFYHASSFDDFGGSHPQHYKTEKEWEAALRRHGLHKDGLYYVRGLGEQERALAYIKEWSGIDMPLSMAQVAGILRDGVKRTTRPPIVAAIPTRGTFYSEWLTGFVHRIVPYWQPGDLLIETTGTLVDWQRNALVRKFLTLTDYEWLIQIDDDVTHVGDQDPFQLLLSAAYANDAKIVSGVYPQKNWPFYPHAYLYRGDDRNANRHGYLPISEWVETPIEVDAVGGGFHMVHRSVFEALPEPWYQGSARQGELGEDLYFCKQARDAGFKIIADFRVPLEHLKVIGLKKEDFIAQRALLHHRQEILAEIENERAEMARLHDAGTLEQWNVPGRDKELADVSTH